MKKIFSSWVLIVASALLVAGCGGTRPFVKSVDEEQSLVFGYIDFSDGPGTLNSVVMKRIKPLSDKPYYYLALDDGMFYGTWMSPGSYKLVSFGSFRSFGNTQYTFNMPSQGRGETDPVISKNGIYYMGSYKYKKVKTGFFEEGKFDIERINKPTEKELLVKLLKKAKHPTWQAAIQKRIDALK